MKSALALLALLAAPWLFVFRAYLKSTGEHPMQGFWCWFLSAKLWRRYNVYENRHRWDCMRCGKGGDERL